MRRFLYPPVVMAAALGGCQDISRFSTHGDHFEGTIVNGDFVRAGLEKGTRLCLELSAEHLQDTPGSISSSDHRFTRTPLRPVPQIWHDQLSMLNFGQGRVQNLLYFAEPIESGGGSGDVMVVVSLMESDQVEIRLLRSAPQETKSSAQSPPATMPIFGIFPLKRTQGRCSF